MCKENKNNDFTQLFSLPGQSSAVIDACASPCLGAEELNVFIMAEDCRQREDIFSFSLCTKSVLLVS